MSRWKALAAAREIAECDLRLALIDALDALHEIADALDTRTSASAILSAVQELKDEKEGADEARDEAESALVEAEARLEEKLQAPAETELASLREKLAEATGARTEALVRLAKVEPLIDAYSDMLAYARKFTTIAESAGVQTRHVRAVKRR